MSNDAALPRDTSIVGEHGLVVRAYDNPVTVRSHAELKQAITRRGGDLRNAE